MFTGVPTQPRSIFQVANTFGFTRETNFGALFDVRSTAEASDLAYTALPLDPHTDNPYRDPVPGVQLLHCLVNETSGGLSTLVDGFAAAQALKARDPEAFELLSTTPIRFRYQDAITELVASATPIELDATGGFVTIHFSPRLDFVPLRPPAELSTITGLVAPSITCCALPSSRSGFCSPRGVAHDGQPAAAAWSYRV